MLSPMRTTAVRFVALGLILSACSVAEADPTTTSTSAAEQTTSTQATTTTLPPTTTSTVVELGDMSPVNGLPVEDPESLERRVLAVKIDNHPKANPQSGLNLADMVIELRVEGITRYISVWQQSDSEYLGPMRSGRPTDPTLLRAMNEPTFAISGAQDWVQNMIVGRDVHLLGEGGPPSTFRISSRSAPHNLYVNTIELRNRADANGYPDEPPEGPLWPFGEMSEYADPASQVTIDFSGNEVLWNWDSEDGLWYRTGYGKESTYRDEDETEGPLGVPVLVALYTEQYIVSPPTGFSGSSLPSSITTGTGKAYVFADGRVIEGTWDRESELGWFILRDTNGEAILVPPGKVWVSLVPAHRGLTFQE